MHDLMLDPLYFTVELPDDRRVRAWVYHCYEDLAGCEWWHIAWLPGDARPNLNRGRRNDGRDAARGLLPPDHERRLAQARARAGWELGDSSWADRIIRAYFDPESDREQLESEREE